MKNLFLASLLMISVFLIPSESIKVNLKSERPIVNLTMLLRQDNWVGNAGEGSCVHATIVSLLRWQGRFQKAKHWKETYGDGEDPQGLAAKMDCEGVRYAYVINGDTKFLDWALRTRRGCGVVVHGGCHFVALVHLDSQNACILDNNDIQNYRWVARETFLSEWQNSGGWAVAVLYTPSAPLPQ